MESSGPLMGVMRKDGEGSFPSGHLRKSGSKLSSNI